MTSDGGYEAVRNPQGRAVGAYECPRCGEPYSLEDCGCDHATTDSLLPYFSPEDDRDEWSM